MNFFRKRNKTKFILQKAKELQGENQKLSAVEARQAAAKLFVEQKKETNNSKLDDLSSMFGFELKEMRKNIKKARELRQQKKNGK